MAGPEGSDFFYPLSPRLTVLLGTMFMRGGADDLGMLDYLNEDDAFSVREKAEALKGLESHRRAAIIAQEIRKQFQFRGLVGLDQVDATWLLAALRGEQPVTIGVILAQLSANSRAKILAALPDPIRDKIPAKEEVKKVSPEVTKVVRQIFESRFVTMPVPPAEPTNFFFKDVVLLEGRELLQLLRALGIEELGAAFLPVGRRKLAELCQRLAREAAEELVAAVKATEPRDAMSLKEATSFLQRMLRDLRLDQDRGLTPSEAKDHFQRELFVKAGLFRLAKSCTGERPIFVRQLAQRLPRGHGRLLRTYVDQMTDLTELDGAKIRRLQDLVLTRVERLAGRGKVNPRFLKFQFCYWGEEEDPGAQASEPMDDGEGELHEAEDEGYG
ncbi:MAG: hypothetical protein HY791_22205 [Deltaproteobacteria bacterium]|nr:hypothetical protein [Deltaproteobacteria bacterium]